MAIDPSEIFSADRQVFPLKPVVLRPNQITYVPISFHPHPPTGAATFLGKSSLLSDRNLHVPDSAIDRDIAYYPVLNLNTFPKRLDRNTSLGVVDPTALQTVPAAPAASPADLKSTTFTFDINNKLPADQQKVLRDLLHEYRDVFAAKSEDVRQTNVATASFELLENKVVCRRPYKISAEETKACFNQVNKMLAGNFIEPSVSIYNSPIMLIRKKSGEYRFICDLRGVNKIIKPISYAMPRTEVYIENLRGSKFFSTFDFKDGYAQLPLSENCRDITSFEIAGVGKFRYKTLPQGLSWAPSLFQMFLDHLLVDLKYPYGISNYFDDACIGTTCFKTHVASLRVFLQRMRDANLSLNPEKCSFGSNSTKVLGMICNGDTVSPDPDRVSCVRDMHAAKNQKQAKSIFGFFSYHRKFIPNFARVAHPISEVSNAGKNFYWGSRQQTAFEKLKTLLLSCPPLRMFDNTRDTRVMCDSSREAIACALYQKDNISKKWHPVAFASRATRKNESNFPIMYLECLSLVFAAEQFRSYLIGLPSFEFWTDHQVALPTLKNPHNRLAKFIRKLSDFNYKIKYVKGTSSSHVVVDTLSRVYPQPVGTIVPSRTTAPALIAIDTRAPLSATRNSSSQRPPHIPDPCSRESETSIQAKIVQEQRKDTSLLNIIDSLKSGHLNRQSRRYVLLDNVLYFRDSPSSALIVVPKHLRNLVLNNNHDIPLAGHFGAAKTYHRINSQFYWPGLRADVEAYVMSCLLCQSRKAPKRPEQGF